MILPSTQHEKIVSDNIDRLGVVVPVLSLLTGVAVVAVGVRMQVWQLTVIAVLLLVNALAFLAGRLLSRRGAERVGGSLMVAMTWVAFGSASVLVSGLSAALGTVALIAATMLIALVVAPRERVWFWIGSVLVSTAIWLPNAVTLPWARFDVNRSPITWLGAWLVLVTTCVVLVLHTMRAYRRSSSIPTRLTVLVVGLALITAAAMGGISSLMQAISERQQVYVHLKADVALRRVAIETWVKQLGAVLKAQTAVGDTLNQLYNALLAGSLEQDDSQARDAVRDGFGQVIQRTQVFREIALVDVVGDVVISTNPPREGSNVVALAGWLQQEQPDALIARIMTDDTLSGDRVALLAQPLDRDGEPVGLLVGWADLDALIRIVNAGTDGWSGRAYLVGPDGVLLTDPVPSPGVPIHSEAVDAALTGGAASQLAYTDHEGVPVLGAYDWVPDLQVAIISEVPRAAVGPAADRPGTRAATIVNVVTALIAALVAGGLAHAAAQDIAQPLAALSDATLAIADGDLDQIVDVTSDDEVGALAESVNYMSVQLHDAMRATQRSLQTRTQALRAVVEVSGATAAATEPFDLLQRVVELIQECFALDYVGLFLLDEERRYAVLRAGTGDVGATMLASGWRLLAGGASMIGQCVASGEPVIMQRATDEVVRLENPLLPNIRSEAAVPIRYESHVLGAITVQSRARDAFGDVRLAALRAVADQVAVALHGSLSASRSESPQPEPDVRGLGALRERRSSGITGYELREGAVAPLGEVLLPEVEEGMHTDGPAVAGDTLRIPLSQADGTLGFLGVIRPGGWQPDDVALVVALAEELQRSAARHTGCGAHTEPLDAASTDS